MQRMFITAIFAVAGGYWLLEVQHLINWNLVFRHVAGPVAWLVIMLIMANFIFRRDELFRGETAAITTFVTAVMVMFQQWGIVETATDWSNIGRAIVGVAVISGLLGAQYVEEVIRAIRRQGDTEVLPFGRTESEPI